MSAVRTAAALALLGLLALPAAAERAVPFLAGRVVDEAGIVPQPVRDRLELRLADLERATGAQVAVLTVESLQGDVLEEYALRVAETWKLGGRERDDGVLLFIARGDRKMRLEIGYGLEDRLTDLRSRRILDEVIGPRFRAGDFGGGVEEGVKAVEAVVRGGEITNAAPAAPVSPSSSSQAPGWLGLLFGGCLFTVVVGTFSLIALASPGAMGWILYAFLIPFHCAFPMALLSPRLGLFWLGSWLVGFPLARWTLKDTALLTRIKTWFPVGGAGVSGGGRSSWSGSSGSSGSSWSSSSSGSSGSSFSGGGGSFGGGGASSSW